LPWLTGHFFARTASSASSSSLTTMDARTAHSELVCGTIDQCPIGYYMSSSIQYEFRRMAVAIAGVPPLEHATSNKVREWLVQQQQQRMERADEDEEGTRDILDLELPRLLSFGGDTEQDEQGDVVVPPPLYPDVELDDAVVHFRCGDLMDSQHPRFGFLKFDSFANRISPNAKTVGIVTQPFNDDGQSRAWDSGKVKMDRCRIVVTAFIEHLQRRFPKARIRVHNSRNETIALTYARLILANQTVAGISTFGVFPAIASFGTGYVRLPDDKSATNMWLTSPSRLDESVDGLVLVDEPNILMVRKVRKIWEMEDGEARILEWFRNPTISYD